MPDVLVTENIVGSAHGRLRRSFDVAFEPDLWQRPRATGSRRSPARALVVRNQTQVTAELIGRAEKLRIIARAGAGWTTSTSRRPPSAGVVVASTPDQNSVSVAELTLGLMLALARRIPAADAHVKAGGWDRRGVHRRGAVRQDAGRGGLRADRLPDGRRGPGPSAWT